MQQDHTSPNSARFTRRSLLQASAAAVAMGALNAPFVHAAGNDKLRIGLVGCGGRGKGAAADCINSSKNVQLVALGDLFPDQMAAAKQAFAGRPKDKYDISDERCFVGWDAYKKVIDSGVDYVILATPPAFRPMMIEYAIKAGKHVFAEKPVAVCPTGVRQVLAAAELAAQKNLGFVIGTQRRHSPAYNEIIKRIQDGAIGKVVSGQVYWAQGGAWVKPRQPEWTDMEWQLRNWMYFTWLAGDHIVEQHMHQHDVANWVMGGPPRLCIATGGRQVRTDAAYGHIFDHFAVDYEYTGGARILSVCRQIDGCYGRVGENFLGTKGSAIPESKIFDIDGKLAFRYQADDEINPYEQEHADLVASIRAGKPLNEGKQAAESTLTAIMGRLSAYSGKLVTWQFAMNSKLDLTPKPEMMQFGPIALPPVAVPGKDPLI